MNGNLNIGNLLGNENQNNIDSPLQDETLNPFYEIFEQLSNNTEVLCENQQRDETDISKAEKIKLLQEIFNKSKANFLLRFGKFLNFDQIELFQQFEEDVKDGYEIKFHLKNISQAHSKMKRHKYLRNKRFAALKGLVQKNTYFSETEMMKRNPLLYDQLVGQYLSNKEKRLRDRVDCTEVNSFVSILMSGIEREQAEEKRKIQEDAEDTKMEDDSSSSDSDDVDACPGTSRTSKSDEKPIHFLWGEFHKKGEETAKRIPTTRDINLSVTAEERQLLKEEFISTMYENFLDGKDDEFDYSTVDDNDEYDNLEIIAHDEEEKYFDSEEPEDTRMVDDTGNVEESSEDELDIYMSALNQHAAVCQLSEDIKKL